MTVNVLLTPPASQPLTLADAKAIIRTDNDSGDHDALLARLIDVARQRVEQDTRRRLMPQTWLYGAMYWPREPYILLPQAPVQRVVSIEYTIDTRSRQRHQPRRPATSRCPSPGRLHPGPAGQHLPGHPPATGCDLAD